MTPNPYDPPRAAPELPAATTPERAEVRRGAFVAVLADTLASVGWRFLSAIGMLVGFDPHVPSLAIKLAGAAAIVWAARAITARSKSRIPFAFAVLAATLHAARLVAALASLERSSYRLATFAEVATTLASTIAMWTLASSVGARKLGALYVIFGVMGAFVTASLAFHGIPSTVTSLVRVVTSLGFTGLAVAAFVFVRHLRRL